MSTKCLTKMENTMKQIIKYAERLHNKINDTFSDLVLTRATGDGFNEVRSMLRMEKLMGETLTLLRHIIDNKDDMINLSFVWHWLKDEEPKDPLDECIFTIDGIALVDIHNMAGLKSGFLNNEVNLRAIHFIRWAYLKDLMPKSQNSKQQK